MKKLAYLLLVCLFHQPVMAQFRHSDSLAYQLQRRKINAMLEQRRMKFGQYEESLRMHTGIFGLQTKKDIRRSNGILIDITKTDEAIFAQIKILLNYRVFQQLQAQAKSSQYENYSVGFMNTINRLREQVDLLKAQQQATELQARKTETVLSVLLVLMAGSILLLLYRKRRRVV